MHVTWRTCIAGLALCRNVVLATHSTPPFEGQILTSHSDVLPAYDYVIVGGGVSGLTVANRLSEDQSMILASFQQRDGRIISRFTCADADLLPSIKHSCY